MSTESNDSPPEPDDERIGNERTDAWIRARVRNRPDPPSAARGLAGTVLQTIQRRKNAYRRTRIAFVVAAVLVAGVGIWRILPTGRSNTEQFAERMVVPQLVVPNGDSSGNPRHDSSTTNDAPRLPINNATTARLFATPPPVTSLDVIDEHQSALLTGLQTMLDEEQE